MAFTKGTTPNQYTGIRMLSVTNGLRCVLLHILCLFRLPRLVMKKMFADILTKDYMKLSYV